MVPEAPLSPSPDVSASGAGSPSFRLSPRAAVAIVLYGAVILLPRLGTGRVLTTHESYFCEPAKEMVATGDWIVPRVAGVPCTFYPPGTHWSIALAMSITGRADEALLRIPSVLAGIATALLIAALAARWFGNRVGLVAGLMELTTYHLLTQARLAESDMLLAMTVCAAMGCFALANVPSPQGRVSARWLPWLFYLAAGAAFLIKALLGLAFIFSGCLAWALLSRDWQGRQWRAVRFLLNPVGLLVFLACVVGWSAAAYRHCPEYLEMQLIQNLGRFQGELGGRKDPFFYGYSMLLLTLPWTPFVVWAVIQAFRQRSYREPLWQFTACWVLPGLLLLSASSFKAKHYLVSLMPPLSILGAAGFLDLLDRRERKGKLYYLLLAAAIAVGCSAGVVAVEWFQPDGAHVIAGLIGMVGAGLLAATYLEYRGRLTSYLVAVFATGGAAAVVALSFVMPYHDSYRCHTEFAQRANAVLPAGTPLYLVGIREQQIVFYLRPPLVRVDDPKDLAELLPPDPGNFYAVGRQSLHSDLAKLGAVERLDRSVRVRQSAPEDGHWALFKINRVPDRTAAAPASQRQ